VFIRHDDTRGVGSRLDDLHEIQRYIEAHIEALTADLGAKKKGLP